MSVDTTIILRRDTALNLWAPAVLADAAGVLKNDGAGNLSWGAGGGGITGPVSSTITALVRWDDAAGTAVRDSNVTLADSGTTLLFSGAGGVSAGGSNQNVTLTPSGTGKSVLAGPVQLSALGVGVLQSDASGNITSNAPITTSGLTQTTARLLGRTTASTGAIEEISVGSGLTLSAGSLTATGGGSGTVNSGTATQLAYYPSTGTAVSSTPAFTIGVSGDPRITSGASGQPVVITPGTSEYVQLAGNVIARKTGADTFFSIEGDADSNAPTIGVFQNGTGVRAYGNYFSTEPTTHDFTVVSRKNNVDTTIFRIQNTDQITKFPTTADATSETAGGSVQFAGGISVAKTVFASVFASGLGRIYDNSTPNNFSVGVNNYTSAGDKYIASGGASRMQMIADNIYLRLAVSGSANDPITWSEAITMVSGNRTLVGNPTDDTTTRMQVNGAIKTSDPTGGTAAAFKMGSVTAIAVPSLALNYLQVDVSGVAYKIALLT